MKSAISFVLDERIVTIDFSKPTLVRPTTSVLNFLRSLPNHKGTKRGCDEGDCGACTVALGTPGVDNKIQYIAVDSCLMFLPMIHGKHLVTIENLKDDEGELHPVQKAMVENHGSQCGFCTPGIVMSMFALYKNNKAPSREEIDRALTGNLCRCTGYEPIVKAATSLRNDRGTDHIAARSPRILELLRSIPSGSIALQTEEQKYFLPASLPDALEILRQHPNALILSGATDVALRVTKRFELLSEIIDLSHITALQTVEEHKEYLKIGSGVALQDILPPAQTHFPALYNMLNVFGSQQIRNLATLGGNLGTASPISDTLPVLMAYNARVVLRSAKGVREVPLDQFIIGYRKTARKQDEIIASVVIPKSPRESIVRSYKVSKRRDFDISTVSGGFRLGLDREKRVAQITLAYGGMAEYTKRSQSAERYLLGKAWNRANVEKAMKLVDDDFHPISDVRASAEMRQIVARNLLLKFWSETDTNGNGQKR
jgi:xanthine dehydrogenase small subunit